MDKRFLLFLVLSTAILIGWSVLQQALFPPPKRLPKQAVPEAAKNEPRQPAPQQPEQAKGQPEIAAGKQPEPPNAGAEAAPAKPEPLAEAPKEQAEEPPAEEGPEVPRETLRLGSDDPARGYPFLVTLTNQGAALESISLNNPRYGQLDNPSLPLKVVSPETPDHPSLLLRLDGDGGLLDKRNWQVKSKAADDDNVPNEVVFRTELPERGLAIEKQYRVEPGPLAYALSLTLRFENLKPEGQEVVYTLEGPNGLPLEGLEYTRTFRDVAVAFLTDESGGVSASTLPVTTLVKQYQDNKVENWTERPLHYLGVSSQYFASVLLPGGNQLKERWDDYSRPILVGPPKGKGGRETNLSAEIHSKPLALGSGEAGVVSHEYTLFAGPKDPDLLDAYGISSLLNYGKFGFVSRPMVALLNFFHSIVGNYGLAIIMLTVLVRSLMFPLSRKQVIASVKMQALKPELDKLKEKYKNDKEKVGRATMELYRQHGVNPLGGCLPMLVQFPIFIGLYWSLYLSVNLRLSKFLYVDNLAAPDHLFRWGNNVPVLSSLLGPFLNLLPIITVILFVVQQKMFTPPATDDQTAMQQKIMSYMMIFFGYMFYRVPAGLCLYFIASSLWGVAERKLLPKPQQATPPPTPPERRKKKDKPLTGTRR